MFPPEGVAEVLSRVTVVRLVVCLVVVADSVGEVEFKLEEAVGDTNGLKLPPLVARPQVKSD